jgi:hypothetical protein
MATINATTSQGGFLQSNWSALFSTWEDTVFYNGATGSDVDGTYIYTYAAYSGGRSQEWRCRRSYLVFDTSVITGTLTSISLNIFVNSIYTVVYTPDMIVEAVTSPTLLTSLTTSDWSPYSYGAVTTATALGDNTWNTLTLNGTGLSLAETENEMTLWLKDNYYDYSYFTNLTDPPGIGYIEYRYNYASFIPYLEYTMVTGYGQTVNGVIAANIGNVEGVVYESISKVLGV